jgi:hemerythrin-like domain-containing protein
MATILDIGFNRRDAIGRIVLATAAAGGVRLWAGGKDESDKEEKEGEVTPAEDLMREHALLSRLLLIYEKLIPAVSPGSAWPSAEVGVATEIIQTFIEDYHEKLEEDHLFPRFQKAGKLVELTHTLKAQHDAGRSLTAAIRRFADKPATLSDPAQAADPMKQFIRMYRPHAARESTVLFPQIAPLLGEKEYRDLGEKFEDIEHDRFPQGGFEGMVTRVEELEKKLGLYDLNQFTPKPV